jgi:hypothetical protein
VRLFDPDDPVNAVMMDRGVLAGLAVRRGLRAEDLIEYREMGRAAYAIGLRPGTPKMCAALSKDVGDFIAVSWDVSARRHFPYLDDRNAKPLYNNGDYCRR